MKLQYVRAFIVLLAGLITLLINMKMGRTVTSSLFIVLAVIVVFYVIGTLVVEILQKGLEGMENQSLSDGENEDSAEETEELKEETIAFSFDEEEAE